MSKLNPIFLQWPSLFLFFFVLTTLFHISYGDVGTAAQYKPPYLPTACFKNDPAQFPTSNLFAAAGDAVWDNGASCGRQYLVRCISATQAGTCVPDQTIQIRIVDYAPSTPSPPSASGATMVLSQTAFETISNPSATLINIEFQQVSRMMQSDLNVDRLGVFIGLTGLQDKAD